MTSWLLDQTLSDITARARSDVLQRVETVFNEMGLQNGWISDINSFTYEQQDQYENSLRLNCVFLKVSGWRKKTGIAVEWDAVYCAGVRNAVSIFPSIPNALSGLLSSYIRANNGKEGPLEIPVRKGSNTVFRKGTLPKALSVRDSAKFLQPSYVPKDPSLDSSEYTTTCHPDYDLFYAGHKLSFLGTKSAPDNLTEDVGRPSHTFIFEHDNFSPLPKPLDWAASATEKGVPWKSLYKNAVTLSCKKVLASIASSFRDSA